MTTIAQSDLHLHTGGTGEVTEIEIAKATDPQAMRAEVAVPVVIRTAFPEAVVEASEEIDHLTMEVRLAEK